MDDNRERTDQSRGRRHDGSQPVRKAITAKASETRQLDKQSKRKATEEKRNQKKRAEKTIEKGCIQESL
jgi:hypothetical protein